MNFKGKFEAITETTLGRFQQGGIMVGDIVEIKKNALNHPKVKEMPENMKGNIKMMMDTDLHLAVTAVKSIRDSRGDLGDGLGLGSTTAPTDFWVDIAVLHSPGLKSDPVTLPIEVLERKDFGGNLPPVPDSLKRKGNINIKPVEVGAYDNNKGDKYQNATSNTKLKNESVEDVYSSMNETKQVTVRVPLEDTEESKAVFDDLDVTYSVIGPNRYELHGMMDNIQNALNTISASGCECDMVDIEYVDGDDEEVDMSTQQIPNETGTPDNQPNPTVKEEEANLEEAYRNVISGQSRSDTFTISIPNAFADNVKRYLAQEGVNNTSSVTGNKTSIDIVSESDAKAIEDALRQNVMGDLTYLKVVRSNDTL